jgi:hypothetical protein
VAHRRQYVIVSVRVLFVEDALVHTPPPQTPDCPAGIVPFTAKFCVIPVPVELGALSARV